MLFRHLQEQLVKRGDEQPQPEEEEVEEEEIDDSLTERIEEARGVLEKLEEIRRDTKDGTQAGSSRELALILLSSTSR